jgi:hypothetical protein
MSERVFVEVGSVRHAHARPNFRARGARYAS